MFLKTYFILCFVCLCFSAQYDVIWDQNYCDNEDRYPSSYKLPHNSPCALCIGDVITLRIDSPSEHFENIYRVQNEGEMRNCDATNSINVGVTLFKDMHEIEIQNAGSNPAFAFQFQADPYYFISTSNGSQSSAQTDLSQTPNSCLQFAFRVLLAEDSNCGNYGADCVFSSVFDDLGSLLLCQDETNQSNITNATGTTTMSTTTMANTVSNSTTPTTTTTATTQSMVSRGLEIVFRLETTDSPGAIAGLSIFLVICILMIIIITPSGIIFLILYWYGKINCFQKKYFFQNTMLREEKVSRLSYKEATGKIELGDIGHPMPSKENDPMTTAANVALGEIQFPRAAQVDEPTYMNL